MVKPLIFTGSIDEQIKWKGVRGKTSGLLADFVFKWRVLDEVSRMGDLRPLIRRLQYLRSLDRMPRNDEGYCRELKETLPKFPEWSEKDIEENYEVEERMIGHLQRDGRWGAWLWEMIGPYYDFWEVGSRGRNAWRIRRAWLCLIILSKTFERPGGYTRKDIGGFARARSRGAARNVLDKLLKYGTLRKPQKGKPRYEYIDTVDSETADKVIDAYYLSKVRRLTHLVDSALRDDSKTERQLRSLPPSIYIAGGPEPPIWAYKALSEALVLASIAMEISLDLPPDGDLHPPKRTIDEFLAEIRRRAKDELMALCEVSREVFRPQWKKWDDDLYDSESEPVLIANLRNFIGERIVLSDESEPMGVFDEDLDELYSHLPEIEHGDADDKSHEENED